MQTRWVGLFLGLILSWVSSHAAGKIPLGKWKPVQSSVSSFGNLLVREKAVQWADGQVSSYRVTGGSGGAVYLKLTAGTPQKFKGQVYAALILTESGGELEVQFCKAISPGGKPQSCSLTGTYRSME